MALSRRVWIGVSSALLLLGAWQVGGGLYINAKALLAQQLLLNAWNETALGEPRVRPWAWADTWPLAKLEVKRMGVETMVLAGASGRTLAFGPGHVAGTAALGSGGNSVISGHRDTHFRFLKGLQRDDRVELHLPRGRTIRYAVIRMDVVDQDDTWVLNPQENQLTLVTCYPFDSVVPGGRERYVVVAKRIKGQQVFL